MKKILAIIIIVVAILVITHTARKPTPVDQISTAPTTENTDSVPGDTPQTTTEGDVIFTGMIGAYDTGCFADGICSVTIDGKTVITTIGFRKDTPVGKLEGVASLGDLETKIGHKATVFAHQNSPTEYTLYGNSAYYIKVQ